MKSTDEEMAFGFLREANPRTAERILERYESVLPKTEAAEADAS